MAENTDLVAFCGLYCGNCYRYQGKIADLARDIRKELRRQKFHNTAEALAENSFFAVFQSYPQAYEVLGALVKLRCKRSCRGGGGPPVCKIRSCCQKKDIEGCWQCSEFETCTKLDFLKPYHEDAFLKNIRLIIKSGTDDFVKGRRYW